MPDLAALHDALHRHLTSGRHHTRSWVRILGLHGVHPQVVATLTSRGRAHFQWDAPDLALPQAQSVPIAAARFRAQYSLEAAGRTLCAIGALLGQSPAFAGGPAPIVAVKCTGGAAGMQATARLLWPRPGDGPDPQHWAHATADAFGADLRPALEALAAMAPAGVPEPA